MAVPGSIVQLLFIIPAACVAWALTFNGWKVTGFFLVMFAGIAHLFVFMCGVARKNRPDFGYGVKAFFQLCAVALMYCIFISCSSGYNYLTIKDPSTSLRGFGVEDLQDAYKRNPNGYDVYMNNGFVQVQWAGYHKIVFGIITRHFSAAPIYKDLASASGTPLAWAIGYEDGHWGQIQGTYCPGGGVCGFKPPTISEGHIKAAKKSAEKGGFTFVDGLPSLQMVNPYDSLKRSEKWYGLFYYFLFGYCTSCVIGHIDDILVAIEATFGNKEETRPLLPEN